MAVDWEGKLDPAEKLDFVADFRNAQPGDEPVLEAGEDIASYSLAVTAEAAALGLQIEDEAPYASSTIDDEAILLWLSVHPDFQADPAFTPGVKLGVVATIVTTSTPPRTRQRTYNAEVKQL